MESEHPICSTEQTQVMCTEVGRNKKKCSGGGAGQVGVQDKGFYGSSASYCNYFVFVPTTIIAYVGASQTNANTKRYRIYVRTT